MKKEPLKVTYEVVVKDGKKYLFLPRKEWVLITNSDMSNFIFSSTDNLDKILEENS